MLSELDRMLSTKEFLNVVNLPHSYADDSYTFNYGYIQTPFPYSQNTY